MSEVRLRSHLDSRSRSILMLLLQSEMPLTASDIASRLSMTPRTVRYRLRVAEKWLQSRGARLVAKPGWGTLIDAPRQTKKRLIRELSGLTGYAPLLSRTERLHVLTLYLLTSNLPLLAQQMACELSVSRSTVLKDLDSVAKWLRKYDLSLVRRPNFGFTVSGREKDFQEAIVNLLLESIGEAFLLPSCTGSKATQSALTWSNAGIQHYARAFLDNLDLRHSRLLVALAATDIDMRFTDRAYIVTVLHLAILMQRARQGRHLDVSPEFIEQVKKRQEFLVAKKVAERVKDYTGVSLTESDVAYIAMRFLGAERAQGVGTTAGKKAENEGIAPEVPTIVRTILERVSFSLHPCLLVDQELIHNLVADLTWLLEHLRYDMPIRNPLLMNIRRQYPRIYQVAWESCTFLGDRLRKPVPMEVVGYITMHLAAAMERLRVPRRANRRVLIVCHAGIATASLLESRIQAEFPQVEIVGVVSASEVEKSPDLSEIDAIISTVPVEVRDLPTIVVNPLLNDESIAKLRAFLSKEDAPIASRKQAVLYKTNEPSLPHLLTADTIRLKIPVHSWPEVVSRAGKLLLDIGAIEASYIQAMKDMILQYGPYMVAWPGIALLHALPENGVKQVCMSLVTLREPVAFGHPNHDPVDIAIALGAVDNYSHLKALGQLQQLLETQEAVDKIHNAVDVYQVVDLISNSFFNE
ncbi:MAG: BglG family transcription antiterminator [Chloroflexi bacterium]|nr:BglG family transcription antiterminator [Chloroflexota bacterium]